MRHGDESETGINIKRRAAKIYPTAETASRPSSINDLRSIPWTLGRRTQGDYHI
jgi:hypothetical protein